MPKRKSGKSKKPVNYVGVANVGRAINLEVHRNGMLGKLLIGQGGLAWIPAGKRRSQKKQIPWEVFAVLMKEWPFGSSKRARLKFVDGALRWRAPGKPGPGLKVTWDDFVFVMDHWFKALKPEKPSPRRPRKKPKPPEPPGGGAVFPQTVAARPVEIPGILEAMAPIKRVYYQPPRRLGLWLVNTGTPKKPAPIGLWVNAKPAGWIDTKGRFHPPTSNRKRTSRIAGDLAEFVKNPEDWVIFTGQTFGFCAICDRKLTNPVSVLRGIGPVCYQRLQMGLVALPAGRTVRPKQKRPGRQQKRLRKKRSHGTKVPGPIAIHRVGGQTGAVRIEGIRKAMRKVKKVFFKAGRGEGLWLVNTGTEARPGAIQILINNALKGHIDTKGFYRPASVNRPETDRVVKDLRKFVKDPAHWVLIHGKKSGVCAICNHPLKVETSKLRGIGPKCAETFGLLPHEKAVARAA